MTRSTGTCSQPTHCQPAAIEQEGWGRGGGGEGGEPHGDPKRRPKQQQHTARRAKADIFERPSNKSKALALRRSDAYSISVVARSAGEPVWGRHLSTCVVSHEVITSTCVVASHEAITNACALTGITFTSGGQPLVARIRNEQAHVATRQPPPTLPGNAPAAGVELPRCGRVLNVPLGVTARIDSVDVWAREG